MKFLSYYLPQFHVIPENEKWHGAGFTEWTNVRKAQPLFPGHDQPRVPHADISYYHLDNSAPLMKQAELMAKFGVYGQVFYHYWFDGKLLLEKPAQLLLSDQEINMPFAFCWANENWTQNWSGGDKSVLIKQNYSETDAKNFIEYLIPFFKDSRYIRVNNRPLLIVYKTAQIPNLHETVTIWNGVCLSRGLPSPYLLSVETVLDSRVAEAGFAGTIERPLYNFHELDHLKLNRQTSDFNNHEGTILYYKDVVAHYSNWESKSPLPQHPSVVVNWDVSPRHGKSALILRDGDADSFGKWLEEAANYSATEFDSNEQLVFINAWNEWAEGAYLEPDSRNQYSYLQAVKRIYDKYN
jgi:hypothetical protein